LAADIVFERNPDFIFRKIVDEAVLVPIHQDVADMDSIYTLNDVGAFIWESLILPATKNDLLAQLLEMYDAEAETLASDLETFLNEMVEIGALQKAGNP
jgi:hypothetical protein